MTAAPSTMIALTRKPEPNPLQPAINPARGCEPECHVKKDGVGSHREPAALGRSTSHGFYAEARIDQRIAEAGECSTCRSQNRIGREPDQSQAGSSINTQTSATLAPPNSSGI